MFTQVHVAFTCRYIGLLPGAVLGVGWVVGSFWLGFFFGGGEGGGLDLGV